jgi:soluble cytochrome b562
MFRVTAYFEEGEPQIYHDYPDMAAAREKMQELIAHIDTVRVFIDQGESMVVEWEKGQGVTFHA